MRVHVEISGMVQGVMFRDSCQREAERHGVAGWVRNTASGTVEAELEGSEPDVTAVLDWCRQGPPMASVSDVRSEQVEETGESGFRVR